MKKLLPTLVFLLVLGAGGAAVYLFQKQRRGSGASENAGAWLPADTQLLLSVPDVEGTLAEWKTTDLYQIWAEPEVQDFLARPLSKLPPHQDFEDTAAAVIRLSPTNVFLALTSLDEKTNQPHAVAGFDFRGDKAEVEPLLAGPKDALRRQWPGGKADLTEYQGHALETFDDGNGSVVASTYLDHRYLIANDLALLKATLDRSDHRAPTAGGASILENDPDFQTVTAKLPSRHATLAFLRPGAGLHRVLDLMAASGQPVDAERRAGLDKLKAIGATTAIEHGKLRDTLYYLAPGLNQEPAKLRLGSLPLTSPATLFFGAALFDLPAQLNLPAGPPPPGTPASGLLGGLQDLATLLQDRGLTMERFRGAFGHEISLHLNWPANQAYPALLATVDVRDRAAAGRFVDDLTSTPIAEGAWQVSQAGGSTLHVWSAPGFHYVTPTLSLTDQHLVLGLDSPQVIDALQGERAGKPNFTAGDAYKNALGMVAPPNTAFVYLDDAALFERLYGTLRGFALFGAALLYPQLGDYVDLAKLPNAQTVSKHLSPTIFSQRSDEQGGLLESVGSFTLGQAAFVVVGSASAAAIPVMQSQFPAPVPKGLTPQMMQSPSPEPVPKGLTPPTAPASHVPPAVGGKPGDVPVSPTPQPH